jgi:hypothetical protein
VVKLQSEPIRQQRLKHAADLIERRSAISFDLRGNVVNVAPSVSPTRQGGDLESLNAVRVIRSVRLAASSLNLLPEMPQRKGGGHWMVELQGLRIIPAPGITRCLTEATSNANGAWDCASTDLDIA